MKPLSNISFIYDLDQNKFTYLDKTWAQLFGTEAEELTPGMLLSAVDGADRKTVSGSFKDLLSGSLQGSCRFRITTGEDKRWVRVTPFLAALPSRSITGNIVDITAEVNNSEAIRKYANKKNSILNMLAHDLRGPLGIANTVTQVLDKEITDASLIKLTKTISKILKQSIDLIGDLVTREFLETVEVELVKTRMDIAAKLSDYLAECRRSEETSKRSFVFSSSHPDIYIDLDEAKFMQVINNLMTNALKFTHARGRIALDIKDQGDSVLFVFSDDGIGIPERFHAHLFEKFTGARRRGLHGEPTVGLGLSIVKTIVEWHHGTIRFESAENKGTTFFIEIPKDARASI